jgi:hypothetical protein
MISHVISQLITRKQYHMVPHVISQSIIKKQYHMVPHVIAQSIIRKQYHMVHMWFHNQSQRNNITWCTCDFIINHKETMSHGAHDLHIIYINSLRPSVCLTGVLGGGGGRGWWSNGRPVLICDGGWTTTVSMYKPSPQNIAAVRRVGMTVESHPSPTAPEADIKTFPSPPPPNTTERTGDYI